MLKKVIAFVPIKLNSERLPFKNIKPILGKPMCFHIVNTLLSVKQIDKVFIYCSSENIKDYIPDKAIYLKRSTELDGNLIKGFDIYKSFIDEIDSDYYILAHTTSPFLKSETIENSLNKVLSGEYDSAFSARCIQTFAWFNKKPINYDINDIPRTQDIEPIYVETSGFYIFKKEIFIENGRRIGFNPYIQEIDYIEAIDIDTQEDYEIAIKLGGK